MYYFLDDMINIKNLESNKKSYKNILICHIRYMMVKEISYAATYCKSFIPHYQ